MQQKLSMNCLKELCNAILYNKSKLQFASLWNIKKMLNHVEIINAINYKNEMNVINYINEMRIIKLRIRLKTFTNYGPFRNAK